MIHYVPSRRWYVDGMLVPSMIEQGIDISDIMFFEDDDHLGNLFACLKSFEMLEGDGDTWHLQDDILLSDYFREETEKEYPGIVCGYTAKYWGHERRGEVIPYFMWYSFPCIRIPNAVARGFSEWYYAKAKDRVKYNDMIRTKKGDDALFKDYITEEHNDIPVYNIPVNIVEHVDWLIGGSMANADRNVDARAAWWEDHGELDRLKDKLKEIAWL